MGMCRVYTGSRELPKTHIARMRIAGPATEETWVSCTDGDPLLVVTTAPSASLASELRALPPTLRALLAVVGAGRSATVVFDRRRLLPAAIRRDRGGRVRPAHLPQGRLDPG